ncbi:HAD-IIB family hydrolase [Methylotuvimicrobium sp. KM1]|uniref:HAD-IIB family hydrolase n=1 Tax=Methylotuvimicrobium sp. KM1 TaxID=3377707 RepID=UPI00384AE069
MYPYLIFSDLDGTLLGHYSYSFAPSKGVLARIAAHKIPLILNSSKTLPEILDIRIALHNNDPFVVENGAAIYIPANLFSEYTAPLTPVRLGPDYDEILAVLQRLKAEHHFPFTGFSELSLEAVSKLTGLALTKAAMAKQRTGSEPLLWQGGNAELAHFEQALAKNGLKLLKGGRFFHAQGQNTDKAKAMYQLIKLYHRNYGIDFTSIALGDSQNDRAMLEQADLAAVIRKKSGTSLAINKPDAEVIYTQHQAPEGWREAMEAIFKRIDGGADHE